MQNKHIISFIQYETDITICLLVVYCLPRAKRRQVLQSHLDKKSLFAHGTHSTFSDICIDFRFFRLPLRQVQMGRFFETTLLEKGAFNLM